jgi:hypothetical protein
MKKKKTTRAKVRIAATKATFIKGIVDLEDLAEKHEAEELGFLEKVYSARALRGEKEAEQLGFFSLMFREAEEQKKRLLSEEERRMMADPGSFAVSGVSNGLVYEKGKVASSRRASLRLAKVPKFRGAISSNRYTMCYDEGIQAMDGRIHRDQGDAKCTTAVKFASNLQLKAKQHKEAELDYETLFRERRSVKNRDIVAKQRQWVFKMGTKKALPLLPGSPVALVASRANRQENQGPIWATGFSPIQAPLPPIQDQ